MTDQERMERVKEILMEQVELLHEASKKTSPTVVSETITPATIEILKALNEQVCTSSHHKQI